MEESILSLLGLSANPSALRQARAQHQCPRGSRPGAGSAPRQPEGEGWEGSLQGPWHPLLSVRDRPLRTEMPNLHSHFLSFIPIHRSGPQLVNEIQRKTPCFCYRRFLGFSIEDKRASMAWREEPTYSSSGPMCRPKNISMKQSSSSGVARWRYSWLASKEKPRFFRNLSFCSLDALLKYTSNSWGERKTR